MLLNLENEIEKTRVKGKSVEDLLAKRFKQATTQFHKLSKDEQEKDMMIVYLTSVIKVTQDISDDTLASTVIELIKQ